MCGLLACAKKEDVGDDPAQLTKDMEYTTAEEVNTYEKQEENMPISEVMDRIVSETGLDKAVPFENTITLDIQDALILLCSTEDGRYEAYGTFSKEYGTMGIILNNRIDGMDNTNYLEEAWDYSYVQPQIYEMEDGKVAFSFVTGSGTGISKEKLILFETFDTGTMKPNELKDDVIKKQMDAQIDCQVDTKNKMVQIVEVMSEKNAPIISIPYEDELEEDVTINSAFFSMDQVKYILGQKPLIIVGVALDIEEYVSPVYVGEVTFQVDYYQDDNGDLNFILSNPIMGMDL